MVEREYKEESGKMREGQREQVNKRARWRKRHFQRDSP
jgi:hypothetical protein